MNLKNKTLEDYDKEYSFTEDERYEVNEWLEKGRDFNSNAFELEYEDGTPMNIIHAIRSIRLMIHDIVNSDEDDEELEDFS